MSKVSPEYAPAPPPASPPFGVETASTEPKKTKDEFVFFGRVWPAAAAEAVFDAAQHADWAWDVPRPALQGAGPA